MSVKEVMKSGYTGERDLFVTRLCLEVLVRNYRDGQGLSQANDIIASFPEEADTPLIHLVQMLIEVINLKDAELFKQILG